MPIHYERDDERHRIVAVSIGTVTLEEALAVIDRQLAEDAWSYGVLYDVRAGHASPSAADVHELLKHVGRLTTQHGPRGRVALVVLDPALSKMARRYASLGELTALDVRVFTSIRQAERWLDLGRA
jgi:hypothetical protein